MGKTRKKPYTKNKAVDSSCKNHGSCPYCKKGRLFKIKKNKPKMDEDWGEEEE